MADLDTVMTKLGEMHSDIRHTSNKVDAHDAILRGNGQPGLIKDMDREKQKAKRQAKHFWLIYGSLISMMCGGIMLLVKVLLFD